LPLIFVGFSGWFGLPEQTNLFDGMHPHKQFKIKIYTLLKQNFLNCRYRGASRRNILFSSG
jgi:hypothetical protein